MKCLKPLHKTLAFAIGLVLVVGIQQAQAVPTGELIVNGTFQAATSVASWTVSGSAERRLATNTINTSGGNAGFDNFLTTAFAVLGDDSGAIGGAPSEGISSISQSFTLLPVFGGQSIGEYDLTLKFQSVFDGRDDNTTTTANPLPDIFRVLLNGEQYNVNSLAFPSGAPSTTSANAQIEHSGAIAITISDLLPGTYTLSFILDEASGGGIRTTNTAVGIDNVSVTGDAIPMVPEPGTFVLLGGGLVALGLLGRNRKRS